MAKRVLTGKERVRIGGWVVPTVIWWLTVIALLFAVVYPVVTLVLRSFKQADGTYGIQNFITVFSDQGIRNSMLNTVKVVFPSTFFATVIGVFLAWAVVRTDIPCKRIIEFILYIPYFIPPFIGAIAWTFLLGRVGYVNQFLARIMGTMRGPINIFSLGGMVFVMSIYRYAVPYMIVVPTMRKISASLEEAGRMSGASPWRTMRDITLPLITPSIIGAALLTFMFVLSDFGVSAILGSPDRIRLMTTQIYYYVTRTDLQNNLGIASAYSIFIAMFGLIGMHIYNKVLKTNRFVAVTGKSAPAEPTKLGKAKYVLLAVLILFCIVSSGAPIVATLITSLTKTWGLPFGPGNVTLQNFVVLFSIQNVKYAFQNSIFLSVTSALIVTVVTLVIGYVSVRGGVRGAYGVRFMQAMVTLPYAVPGTIIALAMILAFSQPVPIVGWRLYRTIWILLIAYVARFLNLGYNNICGAISQIDPSLEEASRMSGATHFASLKDVTIPLLRNSIINSIFLVIAPTISEVSLAGLLAGGRTSTLGTIVLTVQEEGRVLRAASMAILIMFFTILVNAIIQKLGKEHTN